MERIPDQSASYQSLRNAQEGLRRRPQGAAATEEQPQAVAERKAAEQKEAERQIAQSYNEALSGELMSDKPPPGSKMTEGEWKTYKTLTQKRLAGNPKPLPPTMLPRSQIEEIAAQTGLEAEQIELLREIGVSARSIASLTVRGNLNDQQIHQLAQHAHVDLQDVADAERQIRSEARTERRIAQLERGAYGGAALLLVGGLGSWALGGGSSVLTSGLMFGGLTLLVVCALTIVALRLRNLF